MLDPARRHEDLETFIAERAAASDRHGGDLSREFGALAESGWLAACLPPHLGGEGWGSVAGGTGEALDALRTLGRANLSVARLFEGHMNAVKLVCLYGGPALEQAVAARVRGGLLLGVWGADEPSDPVQSERTDGGLRLAGAKRFASGLRLVSMAVVTVETGEGPQMVLADTDDVGRVDLRCWRMGGMRASNSGRYDFTGIELGEDRLLGQPGDYLAEPHFEGGVWRYAAAHCGGAEALYEDMLRALVGRDRAGEPHQQRRIARAAMAIETARLWLERAAHSVEASGATPGKATLSLMAREVVDEACREVMDLTSRALGMMAREEGTHTERMLRDLSVFLCQAAPDAKRARVAERLVAAGVRPEFL
ncbi:acyl-CoA dehydrogenase family protein [Erythrobacter sp.]|uniref:acyl-CoA dehydrogenase family protein n=1 Tax=Erythrobacter sp. TaxID=1042 RepID=UPI0014260194|nr:acyl-CoA dehydrogenase family protein [Erythrobacter sp.]QIQ85369.1 MAG: acyl-CoA dehydrogenase [Erythrobacter sp.]